MTADENHVNRTVKACVYIAGGATAAVGAVGFLYWLSSPAGAPLRTKCCSAAGRASINALITAAILVWNNPDKLSELIGSLMGTIWNIAERGISFMRELDNMVDSFLRRDRDDVKVAAVKTEIYRQTRGLVMM